jgi:hypothetical protein
VGAAVLLLAITGASTLIGVSPAAASTLTVTNCANSGAGSLRQTVANATFFDTIDFALSPACSTIDDPTGAIIIWQRPQHRRSDECSGRERDE